MTEFSSVSVIIPSLKKNKQDLIRLRETVLSSGLPPESVEIIVAIGVSPNGRARDSAVLRARGNYLLMIDSDVSFSDPADLKMVVNFLHENDEVGLCGPAQQLPEDLDPKSRQRAMDFPRSHVDSVNSFRETDMVTHACLGIERDLFIRLGMEHPNLIAGTDPDLRNRVRVSGFKVGLVPNTRVFHPPVVSWPKLIRKKFLTGRWSRWVRRHYPRFHLSADPDKTVPESPKENRFFERIFRQGKQLLRNLSHARFWTMSAQFAYLTGNLWELLFDGEWVDPIPYPDPPTKRNKTWEQFLQALRSEGRVEILHRGEKLQDPEKTPSLLENGPP